MNKSLNIATVFSGIGTPEWALNVLGIDYETIFACEIDKYARETYLTNHKPPNEFYKDIKKLNATKYKGQIDILVGGFPC